MGLGICAEATVTTTLALPMAVMVAVMTVVPPLQEGQEHHRPVSHLRKRGCLRSHFSRRRCAPQRSPPYSTFSNCGFDAPIPGGPRFTRLRGGEEFIDGHDETLLQPWPIPRISPNHTLEPRIVHDRGSISTTEDEFRLFVPKKINDTIYNVSSCEHIPFFRRYLDRLKRKPNPNDIFGGIDRSDTPSDIDETKPSVDPFEMAKQNSTFSGVRADSWDFIVPNGSGQQESNTTCYSTFVLATNNTRGYLEMVRANRRKPGPGEVSVSVLYSGISRHDLQWIRAEFPGKFHYPMVPGVEIVGIVDEIGPPKEGQRDQETRSSQVFRVGDRVGVILEPGEVDLGAATEKLKRAERYGGGLTARFTMKNDRLVLIPKELPLWRVPPLIFSGASIFNALSEIWKESEHNKERNMDESSCETNGVSSPKRPAVGVLGFGALGLLTTRIAKAIGFEVVVFSTTPCKENEVRRERASFVWMPLESELNLYKTDVLDESSDPKEQELQFELEEILRGRGHGKFVSALHLPKNLSKTIENFSGSFVGIVDTIPARHNMEEFFDLLDPRYCPCYFLFGWARDGISFDSSKLIEKRVRLIGGFAAIRNRNQRRDAIENLLRLACKDPRVLPDVRLASTSDVNLQMFKLLSYQSNQPIRSLVLAVDNAFRAGNSSSVGFPRMTQTWTGLRHGAVIDPCAIQESVREKRAIRNFFSGLNIHKRAKVYPYWANIRSWRLTRPYWSEKRLKRLIVPDTSPFFLARENLKRKGLIDYESEVSTNDDETITVSKKWAQEAAQAKLHQEYETRKFEDAFKKKNEKEAFFTNMGLRSNQ